MRNPFKDLPSFRGELHSSPILHRYPGNPILTRDDVPYPASFVFNAGVNFFNGRFVIAPRVDLFDEHFNRPALKLGTGMGWSDDGVHWEMEPELMRVFYHGKPLPWVVDSRLTVLEGGLYLTFCFENQHSERPGIAKWRGEGVDFDVVCLGIPQQRNMVLFPERIGGKYMRLERPSNQWGDPFHIWYAFSPDMEYWGEQELFLGCEDVPWANRKIGAGAPPVKTDKGWLLVFHAVDEDPARRRDVLAGKGWCKRYTCGAALFDKDAPTRLAAITRQPLIVAEAPYETGYDGIWVEDTIFPVGAILNPHDTGELMIYYGAGDANTCLATVKLEELLQEMTPARRLAERAVVPFRIEDWDGK